MAPAESKTKLSADEIAHRSIHRRAVEARFYGPHKPLFEKTWQLADIEQI